MAWVSLIVWLGGASWALAWGKGMDSNGFFTGWKGCFLPSFLFFFFSSLCTSSAFNAEEWPPSLSEWRPAEQERMGARQLDGPVALRRQVSCLCLILCKSHIPAGLRNPPIPAHRLRKASSQASTWLERKLRQSFQTWNLPQLECQGIYFHWTLAVLLTGRSFDNLFFKRKSFH